MDRGGESPAAGASKRSLLLAADHERVSDVSVALDVLGAVLSAGWGWDVNVEEDPRRARGRALRTLLRSRHRNRPIRSSPTASYSPGGDPAAARDRSACRILRGAKSRTRAG